MGNHVADELASAAAERHALAIATVKRVTACDATLARAQRRLTAIAQDAAEKDGHSCAPSGTQAQKRIDYHSAEAASAHWVVKAGCNEWRCKACGYAAPKGKRARMKLLQEPCLRQSAAPHDPHVAPVVRMPKIGLQNSHPSRNLSCQVETGLHFCTLCVWGYWA